MLYTEFRSNKSNLTTSVLSQVTDDAFPTLPVGRRGGTGSVLARDFCLPLDELQELLLFKSLATLVFSISENVDGKGTGAGEESEIYNIS